MQFEVKSPGQFGTILFGLLRFQNFLYLMIFVRLYATKLASMPRWRSPIWAAGMRDRVEDE